MEMGDGVCGGIVECPVRGPVWLPYVEVDEIAATTDRARALGAAVLLEPREGPVGWRGVLATPFGGRSRSGSRGNCGAWRGEGVSG